MRPLISESVRTTPRVTEVVRPATFHTTPNAHTPPPGFAQLISRRVRSGEVVRAAGRDVTIVGSVNDSAEIRSDGSVHVYGCVRGRLWAGESGNRAARIYVTEFYGPLVSIAGHVRLFEELPADLAGRGVQFWLDDQDTIQYAPVVLEHDTEH